jgi:hypothetical protein
MHSYGRLALNEAIKDFITHRLALWMELMTVQQNNTFFRFSWNVLRFIEKNQVRVLCPLSSITDLIVQFPQVTDILLDISIDGVRNIPRKNPMLMTIRSSDCESSGEN